MVETINVFEQLKVDADQQKKLDELDRKRVSLKEENEKTVDNYTTTVQNMLSGKQNVKLEELSKLDQGIQRGNKYKSEISDLSESLTRELNGLGQFFGDLSQYKGLAETVSAKFGFIRTADRFRLSRLKNSDVKQHLETILDYGQHMVRKIGLAAIENMECYSKIDSSISETVRTLEENQPLYEKTRSEKEALERKLSEMQNIIDKANETEHAKLAGEKATLEKQVQQIKTTENHYFTIVKNAKQALPMQKTHLKAYGDMIDGLTQLKDGLQENIKHVTNVYAGVPTILKTALSVKAASQYDKGMKYATDISTDIAVKSAAGVLDEVATRAERPLIEDEKLEVYRKAALESRLEFDTRIGVLKKKHSAASTNN